MGDSPKLDQVPRYLTAAADLLQRAERLPSRLLLTGATLVITGIAGASVFYLGVSSVAAARLAGPTVYIAAAIAITIGVRSLISYVLDLQLLSSYTERIDLIRRRWNEYQSTIGDAATPPAVYTDPSTAKVTVKRQPVTLSVRDHERPATD